MICDSHPRCCRVVFLMLVLLLSGGHWALLQGVAWTAMLLDDARGASLVERASSTFGGAEPCGLCLALQEGVQKDREEPAQRPSISQDDLRFLALPPLGARSPVCRDQNSPRSRLDAYAQTRIRPAPPTPPPIPA